MIRFSELAEQQVDQFPVLLKDLGVLEQQLDSFAVLLVLDRSSWLFFGSWQQVRGAVLGWFRCQRR
jgi:hypothetical protein